MPLTATPARNMKKPLVESGTELVCTNSLTGGTIRGD